MDTTASDARVDPPAADDRSVLLIDHDNMSVGRFDPSSGAVTTDAGWGAPTAIAVHDRQAVYVSDEAGRVWATDPEFLSAVDARLVATRVGAVGAMPTDDAGSRAVRGRRRRGDAATRAMDVRRPVSFPRRSPTSPGGSARELRRSRRL